MLSKRIIPCMDIKDGETVKGVRFENLRSAGDPVELAGEYVHQGADELVFLDITATLEKRRTLAELVKKIAREVTIPFTVGGGISSEEDVSLLLQSGADKISINSAAVRNPELITVLAKEFGSQCVVVAIDTKQKDGTPEVYIQSGKTPTGKNTIEWAREVVDRGAGEILLTSMDHDGTKEGFAVEITRALAESLAVPVIASGGAGSKEDFKAVFLNGKADAALAASIFHFGEVLIPELKQYLRENNITVRL